MNELVNTSAPVAEDLTIPAFLKREDKSVADGGTVLVQSEEDLPKEVLESTETGI